MISRVEVHPLRDDARRSRARPQTAATRTYAQPPLPCREGIPQPHSHEAIAPTIGGHGSCLARCVYSLLGVGLSRCGLRHNRLRLHFATACNPQPPVAALPSIGFPAWLSRRTTLRFPSPCQNACAYARRSLRSLALCAYAVKTTPQAGRAIALIYKNKMPLS